MLDERARTLLKTLVEHYIADGQPVGSRALSKFSGLDLSPATIRNVMADLEEAGFVASPHTSAGRVPTARGYRLFVDSLLTGNWKALGSSLHQLMLPAFTLGLSVMAPIARMVRSTMLEILESDYIKAAWAAGIPRRRVIYGDALANALIPVVTILGIVFGFLMAGNAVVESVFAWPGIGNYAITSLMTKDSGPIQSFVLFVAVLYVVVNFVIDMVYGLIDPRIRLD